VVLQKAKSYNMDKPSIKELMYGGIQELMRNRKYYHHSIAGANYSYWTEDGKIALTEYTNIMVWKMFEAEEEELKQKAKDMVISGLKGEKV
jgi:hypothetical protein